MANRPSFKPQAGTIPTSPGVYRFSDSHGRVIYVGKAINLRSRLSNYFADPGTLHPRTQQLMSTAANVEWTVVANEVEALQLEYAWIKEYDPRFNVKYRDDKSYPYLAVTLGETYPRVQVMRGPKKRGTKYFGPYTHAWAIRETVDHLLRVFPVRTCSQGVFNRAQRTGRPCLLAYIDKCSAPCVNRVSTDEHRAIVDNLCDFLSGDVKPHLKRLQREMQEASDTLDFERAARLRDDIGALKRVVDKSAIVLPDGTSADIFALHGDELEAAIQVFHIRDGRIRGQRGWVVEKTEPQTDADLAEHLLQQVYGEADPTSIPREILLNLEPSNLTSLAAWVSGLKDAHVAIKVPQRGDKKTLVETVRTNAEQALRLHRIKRAGDLTVRSQALQDIQEALSLDDAPLRIECFDVSHLQGTETVASMVVFEDGSPKKSDYRRFVVRGDEGRDDTASMREVITRRFKHSTEEPTEQGAPEKKARFAYPPNLLVVDGGAPQVAAAQQALTELGIVDIALCGLAKRLEEIWVPDSDYPVVLPRTSQGLYLLQRLRDEAHRFAISHHRQRRSKALTRSDLDDIPGLGPAKQKALLAHFGSVAKMRQASTEQLQQVSGVGPALAQVIHHHLHGTAPEPAVNLTTGEILDDTPPAPPSTPLPSPARRS